MPRLSIIIPVLGSSTRLESTLVSVLENRPPDCEILVLLNAPYDDPYDLASEIRFIQVSRGKGLTGGLNEGIEASQAPVVHLLAAGLEVTEGWTEVALTHFKDPRVASVAPAIIDALDTRTPIALGLDYCCRRGRVIRRSIAANDQSQQVTGSSESSESTEVLGPLIQAAFYRRSALELAGGLPRGVGDWFADADLAMTLRNAGYRSVFEPRSIALGTAGDIAPPKSSFRQGLGAERLFWRGAGCRLAQILGATPVGSDERIRGRITATWCLHVACRTIHCLMSDGKPSGSPSVASRCPARCDGAFSRYTFGAPQGR